MSDPAPLPDQQLLLSYFNYDRKTGALVWRVTFHRNAPIGHRIIGRVKIAGVRYGSARVIWKMMTGKDPTGLIDHHDGDHANDRWSNLRNVTGSQSIANRRSVSKTNTVKGISLFNGRWEARIRRNGKQISLGSFDTPEEAGAVYETAAEEMFGEFAYHNRPKVTA